MAAPAETTAEFTVKQKAFSLVISRHTSRQARKNCAAKSGSTSTSRSHSRECRDASSGWGSIGTEANGRHLRRLGWHLTSEMPKNTIIEPVDGAGGFDNVAPRLSVEEGPGGLEWDPSPTYRTRYKGGQDYLAGANQPQGNNWFSRIPSCVYVAPPTDQFRMCCDANNFRVYTLVSGTIYAGRFGNCNSKLVKGTPDKLYDTRGKTCTMDSSGRPTALQGLNGARLEFTFGPSSVTILQKPDATAGSEVRRITSYIVSNRYDRVEVEEKVSGSWSLCRKINFTYHEDVSGAVEGTTGDL